MSVGNRGGNWGGLGGEMTGEEHVIGVTTIATGNFDKTTQFVQIETVGTAKHLIKIEHFPAKAMADRTATLAVII